MENNNQLAINITFDQIIHYIENSPIGYILLDGEANILAVNHLILKVSEYSESQLVNNSYEKLIDYEGTKGEFIQKLDSFVSDTLLSLSWRDLKGKNHFSKVTIWKFNSSPTIYALGFNDITKDKQSSLLSRFAESFVLENNIGLIVVDHELHISEISPLACKLLSVTKNQVLNKQIDDIFHGVSDDHRIVQRALIDGITVNNHAVAWSINQQRYDLLIDSNIIRDENGVIVGAYVVFKDVTNLRSLEQQVRQNDRLKTIGQIAAGTAHEIRNPLTSIKGFLQIIKGALEVNGLTSELNYTDIMLSEIERINKLVNEILLLSKPKDVEYVPTDVNRVIKELQPIIKNESLLHGIEVNLDLLSSVPLVIADAELLKQVFLNIAKNGIEAMASEGTLVIGTKINRETRNVEVTIRDSGPGIPNYIIDKIFEPFFTTKESGTGLGLSICQKIVHDLGGHIRISSKGYGTIFTISLPYI